MQTNTNKKRYRFPSSLFIFLYSCCYSRYIRKNSNECSIASFPGGVRWHQLAPCLHEIKYMARNDKAWQLKERYDKEMTGDDKEDDSISWCIIIWDNILNPFLSTALFYWWNSTNPKEIKEITFFSSAFLCYKTWHSDLGYQSPLFSG